MPRALTWREIDYIYRLIVRNYTMLKEGEKKSPASYIEKIDIYLINTTYKISGDRGCDT